MSTETTEAPRTVQILNRWTGLVIREVPADENGRADLSDAVLRNADLRGAVLSGADLSGADLSDADLSDAVLRNADLRGAVLSGAVLRDAVLRNADLRGAVLSDAVLRGAVLRDAVTNIPAIPSIHRTLLAAVETPGNKLEMALWHTCKTTHCRAGWVVTLAGKDALALEQIHGTGAAAALIYQQSDPMLARIPNWMASNAAAMEDMRRLAAMEAERDAVST